MAKRKTAKKKHKKSINGNPTKVTKRKPSTRKSKKKTSRRSKDPLAALNPGLNLKTRTDLIDYDYVDKLSPKEKLYLARFTEEWTNDAFDRGDLKKNLVAKSKKRKKQCDDMNNARNRCILTRQKASGQGEYLEDHKDLLGENPEEVMIERIDSETQNYHDEYNKLKPSAKNVRLRKAKN